MRDHLRLARFGPEVDIRISPLTYHPKDFTDEYMIPHEAMTKGLESSNPFHFPLTCFNAAFINCSIVASFPFVS